MIFIAILFFSPLRINLQRTDLLTRTYCFDGGRAFFFFFYEKDYRRCVVEMRMEVGQRVYTARAGDSRVGESGRR